MSQAGGAPGSEAVPHCTTTGASVQLMADWAALRHCLQPASRPGITQSLRGCVTTVPALLLVLAALAVRAGLRRALSCSMRCRSIRAPTVCPATAGNRNGKQNGWMRSKEGERVAVGGEADGDARCRQRRGWLPGPLV